jgi:hypothetical protein
MHRSPILSVGWMPAMQTAGSNGVCDSHPRLPWSLIRASSMVSRVSAIALRDSVAELSYAIGGYREPLFHKKVKLVTPCAFAVGPNHGHPLNGLRDEGHRIL